MSRISESTKHEPSNREKGSLVEDIVTAMYDVPGFRAEPRARLEPRGGAARKSEWREIDVLITMDLPAAPAPVRFAVECKNEKAPVPPEYIGAFADKLHDVGIAPSLGPFVSTSRYSSGAIRRAKQFGIRTLLLTTDVADQLPEAIGTMVQPIVFLIPCIGEIRMMSGIGIDTSEPLVAAKLEHSDGRDAGMIGDLVWAEWLRGRPTSVVGTHHLESVPTHGRGHFVNGLFAHIESISAQVHVEAAMLEMPGVARRHHLVNATSKEVDCSRLHVRFEARAGVYPLTVARSEAELQSLLRKRNPMNVPVIRIRVPRVRLEGLLWPPTHASALKLGWIDGAQKEGRLMDPQPLLHEIDGGELRGGFEPVWEDYPALDLIPEPSKGATEAAGGKA